MSACVWRRRIHADCFKVSGRGELHLSVLIENMRREGYEFAVSKAEVLYQYDERSHKLEPMELAYIDVPEEFTGVVIQKLTSQKRRAAGHEPGQRRIYQTGVLHPVQRTDRLPR